MDCYIFDLDGTLADLDHRLHFIQGEVKDWRGFFGAVAGDQPIDPLVKLFNALSCASSDWVGGDQFEMIVLSGRSDECSKETVLWLQEHVGTVRLYMRRAGDYRPDHVVKKELMAQVLADGYKPILIVDDRKQVVDMWRAEGFTCLQCAPGEF